MDQSPAREAPCSAPARCYCRACRPELFARKTDPVTSHQAARRMTASGIVLDHRNRIVAALTAPMTVKEIAAALGDLDHVQVARRMGEIQEQGRAEPTGVVRGGCREWRRVA